MIDVINIPPLQKLCITIGQLPASYLASMTFEEQLLWLCNYLEKTVIPAIDNNAEALEEVQELFTMLKNYVDNYFDNLDVQDEINNKLDEMAEDGILQEIISDYLNTKAIFCFNNVDSMKQATNLIDGSFAQTLGFYNSNDGGSAFYKIRQITNNDIINNSTIIPLNNNQLIAELIIKDEMNIKQFGVIGNNTIETNKFQIAVTTMENKKLIIPKMTVKIDNTINLPNKIKIECFGKIVFSTDIIYLFSNDNQTDEIDISFNGINIEKLDNSFNNLNRLIYVNGGNLTVKNSTFKNFGTAIHHLLGNNLVCENNKFYKCIGILAQYGYGIDTSSINNIITNNSFKNENTTNGRHCIYLNGSIMENAYINNLNVENWHHNPINIAISNSNFMPNINIENCKFKNTCVEAPGENPLSFIGNINVSQSTYGFINIFNIIGENLKNCLIASASANVQLNINKIKAIHTISLSTSTHTIYIRYGSNHNINDVISDNTNDTNFKNVIYIRNTNAFVDNIKDIGNIEESMLVANASNVILGLFSTNKTPTSIVGESSILPFSLLNS